MAKSTIPVKYWRGTREAYNNLGTWDPYTHYSVKETNGKWNTFYGISKVSDLAGQLEPVLSVVSSLTSVATLKQGDRYLVGDDNNGYWVVEIGPEKNGGASYASEISPLGHFSIRVKDRGYKEYQYVNGKLITYNDVDCGTY